MMKRIILVLTLLLGMAILGSCDETRGLRRKKRNNRKKKGNSGRAGHYEKGFKAGQSEIKKMWKREFESDCDNILELKSAARQRANKKFSRARNYMEREYNRGGIDGAMDQVQRYDEKCLGRDTDLAEDLGKTAAEAIVSNEVCSPRTAYSKEKTDWRMVTREVSLIKLIILQLLLQRIIYWHCDNVQIAINACPQYIPQTINSWCPEESKKWAKPKHRLGLERKCRREVDRLMRGN